MEVVVTEYGETLSLIILFLVARIDNFFSFLGLLFAPIVSALGAHEDQVHPVLSRVHERHCLDVAASAAVDIFAAR